jgi:enamine deaminase RidA (YjgF/YER057c/UK114 family)
MGQHVQPERGGTKRAIHVANVKPTFPPYPDAVTGAGLVFLSGIRGGRPGHRPSGYADLPEAGRADAQGFTLADALEGEVTADAWAAHEDLEHVLRAAGTRGDQMVRQHIWQRDKRFFPSYERVRMAWQPAPAPSSGLGVKQIAGAFGRWIGLDGIAVRPGADRRFSERILYTGHDSSRLPSAAFYSQVVGSGPLLFLAGHIPIQTDRPGKPVVRSYDDIPEAGRLLATGRSHPDSRQGPIASQAWYVYDQIRKTLESHGSSLAEVVHVNVFLADVRDFGTFHRVHRHFFEPDGPSLCVTGFDEVGHKGCLIEIESTVLRAAAGLPRRGIDWSMPAPFAAPAATQAGPLVFFSGMLGLDQAGRLARSGHELPRETRTILEPIEATEPTPGFAAQCWLAWSALASTANGMGMPLENLVKTTVYLAEATGLPTYERVRRLFLSEELPAFEAVVIHGPGPVPDATVQVDAIGVLD